MEALSHPAFERKATVYQTSPIKRHRRTKAELERLLDAVTSIVDGEEESITIRHLYYRLVGLKVIEKTEADYTRLCGHLAKWRRSEDIQWDAFTDSTRWHIQRPSFNSLDAALDRTVSTYRRNMWADQPHYVEV